MLWGFQGARSEYRVAALFYFMAVMYSVTFAMMTLLAPLYALHLGFDFKTMGAIVSVPDSVVSVHGLLPETLYRSL